MPHSAPAGHVAHCLRRRNLPHDPRYGAAVDGRLVGWGAAAMTYRYPLPPSANRYWRIYRGRNVVSDEAKEYKHTVAMLAKVDGVRPLTGPVKVAVAVYRERQSGDLDNRLKILLDALQGAFYANDAQIRELHATLHDDKHDPHVEVTVTSLRGGPA